MLPLQFFDLTISIFSDPTYSAGSADNVNSYRRHYDGPGASEYRNCVQYGVRVTRSEMEINSCMLRYFGGGTIPDAHSVLLDGNQLVICMGNYLLCLLLPELELAWQTQVDEACCFQVFQMERDYLTHGELSVRRVNSKGNMIWEFTGADIFVKPDGSACVSVDDKSIHLKDWQDNTYELSFDGNIISR